MIRYFAILVFLAGFLALAPPVRAQSSGTTSAQALAACNAYESSTSLGAGQAWIPCYLDSSRLNVFCNGGADKSSIGVYDAQYTINGSPSSISEWFCFQSTTPPPPSQCQNLSDVSGSIVSPSGGGLPMAASGGCCYIPVNAMGSTNAAGQQLTVGTWEPTGQTCDGTHPGLTTSPSNSPAHSSTSASPYSETSNPDGSKTYCDTQNNKCLTVQNPSGAPASSSSSANNSTNWNSTTSNPASASSTTTTTTTSSTTSSNGSGPASGSSAGAPATWTTTGQQTSKSVTNQPASSSSTSGKCTSAVCDVGEADGQVGQMYTSSGDSVQAEFASFRAQVASTPFAAAVPAFFTFNPSGVCPTWHIPGNAYWGQAGFDFTFFCDPAILAILSVAGWIVLAMGAFSAFRIALY